MFRQRTKTSILFALALTALGCGDVPPEQRVEDLPNAPQADEPGTPAERTQMPSAEPAAKTTGMSGSSEEMSNDEQPRD